MNFKETKSIYLQIVERICAQILSGEYVEEQRIPSVREYAARLEVNANTVMRSYEHLQTRGLIYNQRGIGYFIKQGARESVKSTLKENFFNNELFDFFSKIDKLEIPIEEIARLYNKIDR